MSKFEEKFKTCWIICQVSNQMVGGLLMAAFVALGGSVLAGAGCDHYKKKIRKEKINNKNK